MNTHGRRLLNALLLSAAIALTAFTIISTAKKHTGVNSSQQEIDITLTKVVSCVKHIKLVKKEIRRPGPDAVLALVLENTSNAGILAIDVDTSKGRESYGITTNKFEEGDVPPEVILWPHQTITVEMPINNLYPGAPIRIGGVLYDDGTEEGCAEPLRIIRRLKEREKAKGTEKKEVSPQ